MRPARAITISIPALISFVCSLLLFMLIGILTLSWAGWYAASDGPRLHPWVKRGIAELSLFIPRTHVAIVDTWALLRGIPLPLLLDSANLDERHRTAIFPSPEDDGYLLLAGVSGQARQAVVRLLRISDGRQFALWQPDIAEIDAVVKNSKFTKARMRVSHPLLMPDGDIVFNTNSDIGPLIRLTPCGRIVWLLDDSWNHSNEADAEGNIWVPSVYPNAFPENPLLNEEMTDDALTKVSHDGKLMGRWSFSQILIANGLRGLLFGHSAEKFLNDPIHLNDIQPALTDSPYWKRGDLLISARNLSTVFLYRPSTGRIVWYRTGPWLNQHDVNFVGSSAISVFGNDIVSASRPGHEFLRPRDTNQVYVYDFGADAVSTPFADFMRDQEVRTLSEGRAEILPDGGLFVEETNFGRLLRFSKDRLMWSYINWYDTKRIGVVSWSRYLSEDAIRQPLAAIEARGCGTFHPATSGIQ